MRRFNRATAARGNPREKVLTARAARVPIPNVKSACRRAASGSRLAPDPVV